MQIPYATTHRGRNAGRRHRNLEVVPEGGALGALVRGVPRDGSLTPALCAELRAALDDHLVVWMRDLDLDPERLSTLAHALGPPGDTPFVATLPEHPDVMRVVKEADELAPTNFGGGWHSDFSFQLRPPAYTLLHAVDVPPWGGDTLFSSQVAAWEALSPGMQRMLEPLDAVHSAAGPYGPRARSLSEEMEHMDIRNSDSALARQRHPLVCRHPTSGQRHLFANRAYTVGLADMHPAESAPILDFLHAHATQPVFTCRLRWAPGTLAIWDDRTTQHYALGDYHGFRRELIRATVAGGAPRR